MQETIGKVTLDYRFYPGEDKYSDGEVEDEMLKMAKLYGGGDYNKVIAEEKSWPILYHFSHVRRNIVEWLPMTGQERVLEIGAGPGAITGILAEKAKSVTCIELSKKRSQINAYRNRDHENIRILVGNFQDVAEGLEEKFDLITLIGVFEYAQSLIQSPDPFVDYLLEIRRLLAPGGRLVIAIENRLGLKYWAGATEDHTGFYFEGLEGYPTTDYVRTFAKPELESLFAKSKFAKWEFYYPYPDYKLPERIYSDRYLPRKGELNRNVQNFDRQRMQVFNEEEVYDSFVESGLYPLYANSFFAVLTQEDGNADTFEEIYSKYSNERDPRFRIRTDILEYADGNRVVRKIAADPRAGEHIASIGRKYEKLARDLEGTGIRVNRCEMKDGDAYLEWLTGPTLEEELDELLFAEETEQVIEKIREYFSLFDGCGEEFRETDEFVRVFGKCPWNKDAEGQEEIDLEDLDTFRDVNTDIGRRRKGAKWVPADFPPKKSSRISDIDMIFSNVIHTDRGYELIDYEWTFDFPVPVKFLKYRCLNYYILGNARRRKFIWEQDLYKEFDICPLEKQWFASMEAHFQQYMLGEYQPAWKFYDEISDGVIQVRPLIWKAAARERKHQVKVWFDCGNGSADGDTSRLYTLASGTKKSLTINLPAGARALDICISGAAGVVRIEKLEQAGKSLAYETAGHRAPNGDCLFDGTPMEFLVPHLDQSGQPVEFVYYMEPFAGILREVVLAQDGRIRWMEQTKVWRLYRKIKKLFGTRGEV